MLDLTREWQILVGGTDVSAAVVGWELSREQPDIDTPAWWRGRLTLVGPDLDPLSNSRWRPGSPVQIRVDGTLVFTGKVAMAYYDDWDPVPRLELEVGDVLSLARRQVVPLQEHTPQTLLRLVGATGDIPGTLQVEVSTDMDSPVRLAQQLAWVGSLVDSGLPLTLYTRPDGTVAAVTPAAAPTLEREVGQVVSAKRSRPGLEIPGKVVATATIKVVVETQGQGGTEDGGAGEDVTFISQAGDTTKVTIIDGLGRIKEERVSGPNGETVSTYTYEVKKPGNPLGRFGEVGFSDPDYRITKTTYVNGEFWEKEKEEGEAGLPGGSFFSTEGFRRLGGGTIYDYSGYWESRRVRVVEWPGRRLGYSTPLASAYFVVYLLEEHYFFLRGRSHVVRTASRARGTIEEGLPPREGTQLVVVTAEIKPDEEYRVPGWLKAESLDQPPQPQTVAVPVSAEVEVVGWDGPPMYTNIPWLTNLTWARAQLTLQGAARWLATEVAGRAYARQVVMPVPSEWLANPRPWHMLRLGQEAMWLVGERLVADQTGVRFEALGVLASPPGTIPTGDGIPGGGGSAPPPGLPSLLTFLVRGSPTVGVGAIARPVVPAGALLASMGVGVLGVPPGLVGVGLGVAGDYQVDEGGDTQNYLVLQVGLGVADGYQVDEGGDTQNYLVLQVGLGVAGDYQVDEGGDTQNYLVLQAEEYTTAYITETIYDPDASGCEAVVLEEPGYVEWVLTPPYTASSGVWLRIRYKSYENFNIIIEVDGDTYEEALPISYVYGTHDVCLGPWTEISTLRITADGEFYGDLNLDAVMLVDQETLDNYDWPDFPPCEG